jgi:cation diffusion facilitator family transporter
MEGNFRKQKERVIIISVLSNLALVLMKLVIGFMTGLVSITAEAMHSANDLLASVIAYFGVKKSLEPPDREHQYGHGKIEVITGAIENFLILAIALYIMWQGYDKLIHRRHSEMVELGIVIMLISVGVNFFVSQYLIKKGKEMRSIGIEVDGEHLRADVITSLGVATALILLRVVGSAIWWIDPAAAMLVGVWIMFIFIKLTVKLLHQAIDKGLDENDIKKIEDVIKSFTEIKEYHKIRTRHSGSTVFIDMHIKVPKDMTVQQSHDITFGIETKLKVIFNEVNVLVHVEPCRDDDPVCG